MNKYRREQLSEAQTLLEQAKDIIESCHQEEEEYYENMPENMQWWEKWDKAQEAINNMSDAMSYLDDAISSVESSIE